MIQYMTPERIANAIMQDTSFHGHYLLVEGNKDYKLYKKFVNKGIKIKEAWGCENLKRVLDILDEREFYRKIGIVDADFSSILQIELKAKDLFVTDYHDIEVMLIKSSALYSIINTFCLRERVEEFCPEEQIYEKIMNLGKEIGLLKLANKVFNLGLVFKPERPEGNQLKYKDFISERDLSFIGKEEMIQTAINYSTNRGTKISGKDEIKEKMSLLAQKEYNLEHLVNGHDLTNILFILIKKVLKSRNRMLFDFNSIEDSLILAYEANEFITTQLYFDLYNWSRENGVDLFKEGITLMYSHMIDKLEEAN
jgi:Protein of unknown function (DUF4435)